MLALQIAFVLGFFSLFFVGVHYLLKRPTRTGRARATITTALPRRGRGRHRSGVNFGNAMENVPVSLATYLLVHLLTLFALAYVGPITGRVEDLPLVYTLALWPLLVAGAALQVLSWFWARRNTSTHWGSGLAMGSYLCLVLAVIGGLYSSLSLASHLDDLVWWQQLVLGLPQQGARLADVFILGLGLMGKTKAAVTGLMLVVVAAICLASEFGGGRVRSNLMLSTEEMAEAGGHYLFIAFLVYIILVGPTSSVWGWLHSLPMEKTWFGQSLTWWPVLVLGLVARLHGLIGSFRQMPGGRHSLSHALAWILLIAHFALGGLSSVPAYDWLEIRGLKVLNTDLPLKAYPEGWVRWLHDFDSED